MPRKLHRWTTEEHDIIRRDYRGTRASRREIAQRLEVSEFAVAGQITKLGVATRTDRRPWTPQEDQRLQELTPRMSMPKVAKRMNRSFNSVSVRARRLGCSRRNRDDWYTAAETAVILGKDHKWVTRRIEDGRLKATQHHQHNGRVLRTVWHIDRKDLRTFIRTYPHELTGRNVDLITVVEILAGLKQL